MSKSKKKPGQAWSGMSVKRHRRLAKWLRATGDRLGLRDWTFRLMRTPLGDDSQAWASVVVTYGQRDATIRLCREFADLPREDQRYALTHELLHCHLDRIETPFRATNAVGRAVGETARDLLEDQVREAIEHAVDAIAREVAPHFPLP